LVLNEAGEGFATKAAGRGDISFVVFLAQQAESITNPLILFVWFRTRIHLRPLLR